MQKNEKPEKAYDTGAKQAAGDDTPKSGFARSASIGGLIGGIGASLLGAAFRKPFQSSENRADFLNRMWIREAEKIVSKLGQLKGAAMKLGQMLSLQEEMLPPEVANILSALQKDAPPMSFDTVESMISREIGRSRFEALVQTIDREPFASASIGQVHRAQLKDGRQVVMKVQYPGVDRSVKQDVKQLRFMLGPMLAVLLGSNARLLFDELEQVLGEELDYEQELRNLQQAHSILKDDEWREVPHPVEELCTKRILTMQYVEGMSFSEALSETTDQSLRDHWAQLLAKSFAEGLFIHRFLHADPNAANFAYMHDGSLTFFDFGCVVRPPQWLSEGYGRVVRAMLENRDEDLPGILQSIHIQKITGKPVPAALLKPHADLFREVFATDGYRFGSNPKLIETIQQLGKEQWFDSMGIEFPREIIFIHRTLGGYFGIFNRLKATGPWRSILSSVLYREPGGV